MELSDSISYVNQTGPRSPDQTTEIIVSWVEKARHDNKFWYADDGASFTTQVWRCRTLGRPRRTSTWLQMAEIYYCLDTTHSLALAAISIVIEFQHQRCRTNDIQRQFRDYMDADVSLPMSGSDRRNRLCRGCLAVPTISSELRFCHIHRRLYRDKSETGAFAIIKLPYTDAPSALSEDYLRMYRQVGNDWVVVTDWELKFTGISTEHGYVVYVTHFSTLHWLTKLNDGDGDGLTDLTEDTAPCSKPMLADGKRFQQQPLTRIRQHYSISTLKLTVSWQQTPSSKYHPPPRRQ